MLAHKPDGALETLFAALTEAAARQALAALDRLPEREDANEHDRGARSVESLIRVAATAATLRAKLQKDAALHDETSHTDDGTLAGEAGRLADFFDAELRRIRATTPATAVDGGHA